MQQNSYTLVKNIFKAGDKTTTTSIVTQKWIDMINFIEKNKLTDNNL